jgi:hypothetical protein
MALAIGMARADPDNGRERSLQRAQRVAHPQLLHCDRAVFGQDACAGGEAGYRLRQHSAGTETEAFTRCQMECGIRVIPSKPQLIAFITFCHGQDIGPSVEGD